MNKTLIIEAGSFRRNIDKRLRHDVDLPFLAPWVPRSGTEGTFKGGQQGAGCQIAVGAKLGGLMMTVDEVSRLIVMWGEWVQDNVVIRVLESNPEWVEIVLPFLDTHNDHVVLYVRQSRAAAGHVVIGTDDGLETVVVGKASFPRLFQRVVQREMEK